MDDDQQFCLRWNNHQSTLISVFDTLLENGTLVDCTLAAEGKFLKAHKVVLSACSPYFAALLSQQYDKHPIFILKDIKFQELRAMMDYMYRGEVNISQDQLAALLKAAESLQIKGLSESRGGSTQKNENVVQKQPVPVVSKSGLTIEHKRPANKHPTSAATESDVSMSREGSTSPTSRKRKKFRRRSIEVNNMDNHDQLSNSSSQSQSIHMTSIPMTAASQITSATSAANVLNVTKKTDHHDSKKDMEQSQADDDEDDDKNDLEPPAQRQKHDMDVSHIKEKMQSTHSELLIEPKNEYDDGQDETVEDLTLDDEELLEDLDQAGPSHGGEGSSQGYAQWQVGQNQDEVFLAAQEAAGQHRDAQGDQKMMLTEGKKIKVALSELQRCIPIKMGNFTAGKQFECKDLLPISSLDELEVFDSYLKTGTQLKADYTEYLLTLGGKDALSVIKAMVGESYALQLQSQINWTGKGGKYEMSKSASAACIIECTMFLSNSSRFKTEYMFKYHLQHSSDRIRSENAKSRKQKSDTFFL
ncbi:longitudinals lacking protein, isoforms H/M/V isoform X12 [Bradysia coprophila]|uniref:longitudinals lacking protein, isoforms H/M/V isoform X12 n=1 Tax=Bradysia coprophila TaxID=38358 RepID=UPI00187D7B09|nr:longitudinals lacking protein, isoforms H/M/V isoform X12 [Bradysia coprophila]